MFDGKYAQKHLNAIPSIMEAIYLNCKTFRLFQDKPSLYIPTAAMPPGGSFASLIHLPLQ